MKFYSGLHNLFFFSIWCLIVVYITYFFSICFLIVVYITYFFCLAFLRFETFIWDNDDINPETLTGVSLHCTNGIIVQICTKRETTYNNKQDRNITRKISFLSLPNTMAYYVSKKRVDPCHLAQADLEESIKSSLSNSQCIDFIWALGSYYNLGHNIFRLFDVLPNLSFTISETNRHYE